MTGPIFLPADWPAPPGVIAGTTLRSGGASTGRYASLNLGGHVGDDPDAVARNRRTVADAVRLPAEPRWLRQVHATDVVEADGAGREVEADASWTAAPGVVCAVMTADCLPVLMATDDGSRVAAAHAGWRGLCAGVLENAVKAMDADPAHILAWLGPAISQKAFEVGDEVRRAFVAADSRAGEHFAANPGGRWQADLYGLARQRLQGAGVSRVFGGGLCTYSDERRFFSHRRAAPCGRMASIVFRNPDPAGA